VAHTGSLNSTSYSTDLLSMVQSFILAFDTLFL